MQKHTARYMNVNEVVPTRLQLNKLTIHKDLRDVPGVIVVIHKLPVNLVHNIDGTFTATLDESRSYIHGFLDIGLPIKWVGFLDRNIDPKYRDAVEEALWEINCKPIFVD